jgi:hypothetical protein
MHLVDFIIRISLQHVTYHCHAGCSDKELYMVQLSCSSVPSSSDIRTKRRLAIFVAIPVIIFFPSVTRQVLIQPLASDMQIVLVGKKDFFGEVLVSINLYKCTLTEKKHPIMVYE